ncbi:MAG: hypothetical protein KF781_04305 [Chitinophagaceae bacterium]|nr:hypothetical protein [Chitinophagaceae bacterium]MCW5904693.1 hypothetical protein [Chitinophagaceae bacterium]
MKKIKLLYTLFAIIAITSCSTKETLTFPTLEEVYPIQEGKIFIYRLDSTVLGNFNKSLITKSYIAKDSIADQFTDAAGRKSFKVFRFITDTLQSNPWAYSATFFTSIDNNRIEFIDNENLRFITLVNPVRNGVQWHGTQYINAPNTSSDYFFMKDWYFEYQNIDEPFTVLKGTIQNTYTILQADEADPPGPLNPNLPRSDRAFSKEVYAKNIGLIYKEFLHWEWQNPNNDGSYTLNSYGIKLNLIDYK